MRIFGHVLEKAGIIQYYAGKKSDFIVSKEEGEKSGKDISCNVMFTYEQFAVISMKPFLWVGGENEPLYIEYTDANVLQNSSITSLNVYYFLIVVTSAVFSYIQ